MSQLDILYERMNDDLEIKCLNNKESEITKFYAGKTLFITGATGFVGTCLVEKLLRSCPDLKHIYILMRQKGNVSVKDQLKQYFQNEIFDRLKQIHPDFEKKVTVIKGDLIEESLGISNEDRSILKNEVNIMYHNAANVMFDVKVNLALRINVLGTKYMLDLAQECKNLEIFMYVSTAYSHCYKQQIEEQFYPPPADLSQVYETLKADNETENGLSDETVQTLLGKFPNIYTYTKAIAEDLVRQYAQNSKCAYSIYRLSIVTSTLNEPLAGWCGNTRGPMAIILGTGLGIIHAVYHFGYPMDFIPSDLAVNALIAITWNCCKRWDTERMPVVYNYGSSTVNPTGLKAMYDFVKDSGSTEGSSKAVWMNSLYFADNTSLFWIMHILFHFIPACILDIVLAFLGKKIRAVSLAIKVTRHLDKIAYFGNGNWRIYMPKTLSVIDQLNSTDRELFFCDIRKVSWDRYIFTVWRGLKLYILKESLNSDAGRRKYNQLWYLHYGFITVCVLIFCYCIHYLFV